MVQVIHPTVYYHMNPTRTLKSWGAIGAILRITKVGRSRWEMFWLQSPHLQRSLTKNLRTAECWQFKKQSQSLRFISHSASNFIFLNINCLFTNFDLFNWLTSWHHFLTISVFIVYSTLVFSVLLWLLEESALITSRTSPLLLGVLCIDWSHFMSPFCNVPPVWQRFPSSSVSVSLLLALLQAGLLFRYVKHYSMCYNFAWTVLDRF